MCATVKPQIASGSWCLGIMELWHERWLRNYVIWGQRMEVFEIN